MSEKKKKFGERELVYVTHPVSPEVKAQLVEAGLKIVDAAFAGPDDDVIDGSQPLEPAGKPKKAPAGKQAAKAVNEEPPES